MITSQYQSKGNIIGEKIAYKLGSSPSDRIPHIFIAECGSKIMNAMTNPIKKTLDK